jgi:predicted transcriptional regulator
MIDMLPRREREIFEILCRLGEATAVGVREAMADAPSHSAVRTLLGRLEAKGLLKHREVEQAYVYRCAPQATKVRESALRKLVSTFFSGSGVSAATALVGLSRNATDRELATLQKAIDDARGRRS